MIPTLINAIVRRFSLIAAALAIAVLACSPGISSAQSNGRAGTAQPAATAKPAATVTTGATGATSVARPLNPAAQVRLRAEYGKLPLAFEANQGQTDGQVKFLSRGAGYTLFLTGGGAVLDWKKKPEARSQKSEDSGQWSVVSRQLNRHPGLDAEGSEPRTTIDDLKIRDNGPRTTDSLLAMRLIGSNPNAPTAGEDELPGKSNYFIGNDPKKWRTNVANYAKVRYRNVYPGIDLVYYGNQGGRLEYDFVVAPGADPSAIKLDAGAVREPPRTERGGQDVGAVREPPRAHRDAPLRVTRNGDLIVKMDGGEVRFNKPVVYQMASDGQIASDQSSRTPNPESRTPVEGRYRLRHHQVTFEVAKYDRTRPLVIDPALSYAANLGAGSADVSVSALAVDGSGNTYITGSTYATDFPVTPGAFQTIDKNSSRTFGATAFVTKLNSTGTAVVYSTYLGGSSGDMGTGIAIDSAGDAVITGGTWSSDFPTTPGAFQTTYGPCCAMDTFVTKLSPDGSSLIYSTFLGGNTGDGNEAAGGIALDASGAAYVSGVTYSTDFPTTPGAFQSCSTIPTNEGAIGSATYISKLDPTGATLDYSTCLAGGRIFISNEPLLVPIAVDASGDAYVAGTIRGDLPTTPGAFQTTWNGLDSGFVTKLNSTGTALAYSTYLGQTDDEGATYVYGIAVDSNGDAYVVGTSSSQAFPTTSGAFDTTCESCPQTDTFVTELSPAGSQLVYSTYLGGSNGAFGYGIGVDSSGDAWVTGATWSDFPITPGAFEASDGGFLTEFDPTGSSLLYSTYYSIGVALAVDSAGSIYTTGSENVSAPTPGAVNECSLTCFFVSKFVAGAQVWPLALDFGSLDVGAKSSSQTVSLTNSTTTAFSFSGASIVGTTDFSQTNSCPSSLAPGASCSVTVTLTPSAAGSRTAMLNITDGAANSPQTVALSGAGIGVPVVGTTPASLSFGNQLVGTTSSAQTIMITNTGTATMTISSIAASASYAETNTCGPSVAIGASCTVSVTFAPAATGAQAGTISITDNAPAGPQTISLTGTGVAPLAALSPSSLTFGSQAVGTTSSPQTITLTNSGTAALVITSIGALGDFAVSNNCGTSLAAGASCSITVVFSPQITGTRSGSITLTDSAANSPQTIALTGTAAPPLGPMASLSPSSLTFPGQFIGTSSLPETVTLTNSGGTSLTVTAVTASSGEYGVLNACGSAVAAGESCAIGVFFDPSASGSQPGTLTISDNAPGGHQSVALSGAGMDFSIVSTSPGATISQGGTVGYGVFVVPAGGFKGSVSLTCSGAPAQSTCTVTPSSITPGGSSPVPVQVSVTTTSPSGADAGIGRIISGPIKPIGFGNPPASGPLAAGRPAQELRVDPYLWPYLWLWVLLLALAMLIAAWRSRPARRAGPAMRAGIVRLAPALALLLVTLSLLMAGCGGASMSPVAPNPNTGTPTGSYNLTVTGTFKSGTTVLVHSVVLKLTVQ